VSLASVHAQSVDLGPVFEISACPTALVEPQAILVCNVWQKSDILVCNVWRNSV